MSDLDMVLVERLAEMYDPFAMLELDRPETERQCAVISANPNHAEYEYRDAEYHYGRIRYFMEQLQEGASLTPLEVDNDWNGLACLGVTLLDGHHRLCAAVLANQKKIPVHYGGWVSVLNYLTGKRKKCPLEM